MRVRTYLLLVLTAFAFSGMQCSKYKDPPPTEGDSRLTTHYCNDPRAVNYNWGFPGIPDDSVCIYPSDLFAGSWQFQDSVFLPDSTFITFMVKDLVFHPTEDTVLVHLSLSGWCADKKLMVTADKYGQANLDSLPDGVAGQILCAATDTITGSFLFPAEVKDSINITCRVVSDVGVHIHRGWAIRQ